MASVVLVDFVQSALNEVTLNNFKFTPEITVDQGSASGDGYASKTYSINLKGEEKDLDIFVKYLPQHEIPPVMLQILKGAFSNEHRFYGEVYPAMLEFQKERNIDKPFNNVPKHYATSVANVDVPPILLQNIKVMGYNLWDRRKPIDDKHVILALKTFAKYHAISYAIKNQNREKFEMLGKGLCDLYADGLKIFGLDTIIAQGIQGVKDVIDPVTDKKLVDILSTLEDTLMSFATTIAKHIDEYAVINHGDCWSNNMMFLYDENTGDPVDVKFLDWQLLRVNSPVFDVAYFFYTVARKPMLDDLDRYMNCYHDELSTHIRKLGSNPELLYPFEVFMQHWKKFSKFGLAMSFMAVKALLFEESEVPNIIDPEKVHIADSFGATIKHQNTYNEIIVDLLRHFVARGFV